MIVSEMKKLQSITTATLTRLLAIKIVANRYSERANRFFIKTS